jgi:hypothetical protein
MTRLILNFVLFQVAWFACVLGGAQQLPWVGPAVVVAVVWYHLWTATDPRAESVLLAVAFLIGSVFDSLVVSTGWLAYPSGQWHPELAPYWILAMWVAFATTLNVSLGWLKGRPLLAAGFGAIGGPLAYFAGAKLGGVTFVEPTAALLALGVGWAVIMPALMGVARRLDDWPAARQVAPATE